ncbi:transposase [Pseudanabaenaceae cyanobacterium LEGE 13415]|nr:transposase [Pseudanabaenaceae cyanobacterium LEGE 13415]
MTSSPPANYDASWKEALERYFELFLAFFFPQIHTEVDWQRGCEFLDSEFQQVVRDAEVGKRFVDKLVKVWRRDGDEVYVLIHAEIQSQYDAGFSKRMYVYSYRIFDRYNREVVSLAILGDSDPKWRPSSYHTDRWGCRVGIEFPIVKLLDYAAQTQMLEQSLNPFARLVYAHLQTQATTGDARARLTRKLQLILGMQGLGYSEDTILELFRFIDLMMTLPPELDRAFDAEIRRFGAENVMPYLTTVERFAQIRAIASVLDARFGEVSPAVIERLERVYDSEPLDRLLRGASTLNAMTEFEALLEEIQ